MDFIVRHRQTTSKAYDTSESFLQVTCASNFCKKNAQVTSASET